MGFLSESVCPASKETPKDALASSALSWDAGKTQIPMGIPWESERNSYRNQKPSPALCSVVGKVGDPCDTLALGSGLGLGFRL